MRLRVAEVLKALEERLNYLGAKAMVMGFMLNP